MSGEGFLRMSLPTLRSDCEDEPEDGPQGHLQDFSAEKDGGAEESNGPTDPFGRGYIGVY
jgi:hypothetical protein